MTDKAKIWELITEQLSEKEAESVFNDINNSEELKRQYVELQRIWSLTGAGETFSDAEIEERLDKLKLDNLNGSSKRSGGFFLSALKYAAVFAISFVVSWLLIKEMNVSKDDAVEKKDLVFETFKNQVAKATLPDGSVVWLNSSSKLEISDGFFSSGMRDVQLTGEALFEVSYDKECPFIVHTKQGSAIRVLGTKFDVDAYSSEKVITTLFEGAVELKRNERVLAVLKPGEQAVYFTNTGKVEINRGVSENVFVWKENVLVFKDEELQSLIPKLEKFYHVRIFVDKPELNNVRLSGRAFKTYSIEEVLDVFKLVSDIRYKVKTDSSGNKTIHIY
jgi:ferric-dicitrate binding protein FerR (iron transport regulator)